MFYGVYGQFYGVREAAANIGLEAGNYTAEMFREDFPQFFTIATEDAEAESLIPAGALDRIIALANVSVQPDKWLEWWRYACGLYVAHYATLFLQTYAPGNTSAAGAAASGALTGIVKSAKLGDSEVSYDTSAVTKSTEDWGDLNATVYGQQLASRARLVGMSGTLVI